MGTTEGGWRNLRADFQATLAHLRIVSIARPAAHALSPTWKLLTDPLPDYGARYKLRSVASYCTSDDIQPVAQDRSLGALVRSYLASDAFHANARHTQAEYRRMAEQIADQFGDKSTVTMELPHVHRVRDAFGGRASPWRANQAVAVLSVLMEHARALGWRKDNPALRPGKLPTRSEGYRMWTGAEYRARQAGGAPAGIKLAVALAYYTGLRAGDLMTLRRSDVSNGAIRIITAKTGAVAHIPLHPELVAALAGSGSAFLPEHSGGRPWSAHGIKHALGRAVKAAGLPAGLSFHGLRKGLTAALVKPARPTPRLKR